MSLDRKIISEIERYRNINKYITEQALDAAAPPPPADPAADLGAMAPPPADPAAAAPPPAAPAADATPQPIDVANDPDVEKIDDEGESEEKKDDKEESGSEELDITELVDSQKSIEQKQEDYFENLFGQLTKLESKLGEMDQIMSKLNTLEAKIEKYREKTPQEKLELRTYDSYPFNQKLSDFFDDKKEEMELTGKKDYVLTSDDVTDINANDIKKSFQPTEDDLM
jgi:molecular chaperone GrpE (heat shock protein)